MNTKNNWLVLGVILMLTSGTVFGYRVRQNANSLTLTVRVDKESYLPGEIVFLRFKLANESADPASFDGDPTVWEGNLRVFAADEAGLFKEYFGPGWGARDMLRPEPLKLLPGQSLETEATVLWNQKIETGHLSELYAKKAAKQRLGTDYALTEPGKYHIKAVLHSPRTGTSVESPPIQITVEDPQGDDLDVWKALKQNGDYGFFLQTGGLVDDPKGPKTLKVVNHLQNLVSKHPNSRYATRIRQSLLKRQESIEQIDRN